MLQVLFVFLAAIARAGRDKEWETGAGTGNRTYLKRVNYLQMSNYQLFRKMQLAFNHVLISLKSELDFDKLLIVNGLTKYNSLQTFVLWRPWKQHLCRGNGRKRNGSWMEVGCFVLWRPWKQHLCRGNGRKRNGSWMEVGWKRNEEEK